MQAFPNRVRRPRTSIRGWVAVELVREERISIRGHLGVPSASFGKTVHVLACAVGGSECLPNPNLGASHVSTASGEEVFEGVYRGRRWSVVLVVGLSLLAGGCTWFRPTPAGGPASAIWAVQLPWSDGSQPWPESVFAGLAQKGITQAEINLDWSSIEPRAGVFEFTLLDTDLRNAAAAHVKLIPIFWESVWAGNPAPWITSYDLGSTGTAASYPAWWSASERQAYFTYVTKTIAHIHQQQGFGGAFLNYGWLDYMWGPPPGGQGVSGYAPQDIARFHTWLPTQYANIAAFDRAYATTYTSFAQVPAATPGQPLFPVYQAFRAWSVKETYSKLTALVRQETSAPLYYYWGGGFSGAGIAFNLPDIFFQVAKRYHATVVLDDADHTGVALLFGSLSQAYNVPLLEEWTPRQSGFHAEMAEFLGHFGFESAHQAGLDFFLYQGADASPSREYVSGFPVYMRWLPAIKSIRGAYPLRPVAVYISYAPSLQNPTALSGTTGELATIWRNDPLAFTVVTNLEIQAGVVRLGQFKAVLPLLGRGNAQLTAYAKAGGKILAGPSQLTQAAPPYAQLHPNLGRIEVVPTVVRSSRHAWITVSDISPVWSYDGVISLDWSGLGLPRGTYRVVGTGGQPIATYPLSDGAEWSLQMSPGGFAVLQVLPGKGPTLARTPSAVGLIEPP